MFLISQYIHRELVVKNVLSPSSLLAFLLGWVDDYTAMQIAKFLHLHLVAGCWYLDCSRGFVPEAEMDLYNTLVSSTLEVIILKEEPEEDTPAPLSIEKDVAPLKGKGKGRKFVPLHFLKFLLILTSSLPFNSMLLQPPPWLEVPPPLPLPLLPILLPLYSIAAQPSHRCLARGRLLHRILLQPPQRAHILFH